MNRRFSRSAIPLVASVLVGGLGCAKPGVVGKWQGSTTVMNQPTQVTFDFTADKRMTQVWSAPPSSINASGTYTLEDDKLTATMTDVQTNPPALAAVLPKDQLNLAATYKLDGDSLVLTYKGQTLTFNRVKEDAAK